MKNQYMVVYQYPDRLSPRTHKDAILCVDVEVKPTAKETVEAIHATVYLKHNLQAKADVIEKPYQLGVKYVFYLGQYVDPLDEANKEDQ